MTFPADPAVVTLRAAFGADVRSDPATWVWTDITAYWVASEPLAVSDGRSEGATQAEAAEAIITVDATDGALMPEDPRSPWWPHVDVGTPVWVTVDAGAGPYDLVQGFISALRPVWPGRSAALCWVRVTVRGVLDRLGRGTSPLRAPLVRAILGASPVAYWPLDDGREATHLASGLPGGAPMVISGVPVLAAIDGPAGSPQKFPELLGPSGWLGTLSAGVTIPDVGQWSVECWMRATASAADGWVSALAVRTTGTLTEWIITLNVLSGMDAQLVLTGLWADGHTLVHRSFRSVVDGAWHRVRLSARQTTPSSADVALWVDDELWEITESAVVGRPSAVTVGGTDLSGFDSLSLAHVAVINSFAFPSTVRAASGWEGEAAAARIARLCAEEGVPVTVAVGGSEPMGVQPVATFLDLLRECEAADLGRLAESGFGLAYRPRTSLYNQAVRLTVAGVADPFAPTLDLQRRRNEWTVSRSGGSSAVHADQGNQALRGRLQDSCTVNVASDRILPYHAQWRVGLGVVGGLRYPSLSVDLGRHPDLIGPWQGLHLGDRIQVTRLPRQHPGGVDQLLEGRTQLMEGRTRWTVTVTTSPARPYEVWTVEGAGNLGRLDASTATLAETAAAAEPGTVMVLSVATATGPLLTTTTAHPEDFPIQADLGGEQVTITNITGASSPQTVTVTRGNGVRKGHPAGTALRLWCPGQIAL